ncbi:MAG: ankyrin repeat domain-containing protein [Lachnospiraceae bacterium]|nr:ankyrin repeat domain-containing protein [Lachnospiraceae bacterium]
MAKRKTLIKDFEVLVKNGNDDAVKEVFNKCDINAYGGYGKGNALFFLLSFDMMKWLIERGTDIEYVNQFHYTPLFHHACHRYAQEQAINLIKLGADVSYIHPMYKTSLLHAAVSSKSMELIKVLMEIKPDVNALDYSGNTPLESAFYGASTMDIIELAPVTEYLLSNGVNVTEKLKAYMKKAAKDIEFRRESINPDYIGPVDNALESLYKLIGIEPVPRHERFDGKAKIIVKEKTWQKQHSELWKLLVPGSGHANTVQGEVIRIAGRIGYEILDNGGCNWDREYRKMAKCLLEYVLIGNKLEPEKYDELKIIISALPNTWEEHINRMTELSVEWVILNPEPVLLQEVKYKR